MAAQRPNLIHCLLVGGLNAAKRLDVKSDAQFIELKTLSHLRPIVKMEEEPEPVYIKEIYEIHPFSLTDSQTPDKPALIAIGVPADKKLTWAMGELIRAYCEQHNLREKEHDSEKISDDSTGSAGK